MRITGGFGVRTAGGIHANTQFATWGYLWATHGVDGASLCGDGPRVFRSALPAQAAVLNFCSSDESSPFVERTCRATAYDSYIRARERQALQHLSPCCSSSAGLSL